MPKQPFSGAQKKKQMKAKRERARIGVGEAGHKPSFKDSWDFGAQEKSTRDTGDGSYGGGTATAAAAAEKNDAQKIFHGGKPVVLGADGSAPAAIGPDGRIDAMGNRGVKAPMFGGGASSLGMSNESGYRLRTVLTVDSKETIEARKTESFKPLNYVHGAQRFVSPVGLDESKAMGMPKRIAWDPSWSAEALEAREEAAFQTWLDGIYNKFESERLNSARAQAIRSTT